jgi:hypothetical protein
MVTYYQLGSGKQLNDIVMAGSHDAAITQGGSNAQTQDLDIYGQADAGVRIFDIRITGAIVKSGGAGDVGALKAYHGSNLKVFGGKQTVVDLRSNETEKMKIKPMKLGTYGMTLSKILSDAARFVQEKGDEFLILKFDKCDNWPLIAEACVELLGDNICKLRGSLNTRTLSELRGKVIVLFSVKGREATGWTDAAARGILAFQNMTDGGTFNRNFDGLQYFGKGGTNAFAFWRSDKDKLKENMDRQAKLMQKGAATDPKVMGMMYWTSTGLTQSIESRNDFMWNDENTIKLMDLWATRVPKNVDRTASSSGPLLKEFMPNFVMIDFATPERCAKIYDLNLLAANRMSKAVKKFYDKKL